MVNTMYKTIMISEPNAHTLLITLNRPEVRNAINLEMIDELAAIWKKTNAQSTWRCILLTGEYSAFCAGADLKARSTMDITTWKSQHSALRDMMHLMLACPLPIISLVNGAAFGGGLELVLASDFAYAAKTATFSQSEVKVGIIPGAMGTQHLPRAVGLARAKELTFTGDIFSADEAYQYGIVNKVCVANQLLTEGLATAEKINANAPLAIAAIKRAINHSQSPDLAADYDFELACYQKILDTHDRAEGIRAFVEKRKPHFSGE